MKFLRHSKEAAQMPKFHILLSADPIFKAFVKSTKKDVS